jgi:sigma-B regulation protein RsbU (phosphoserine phosphatase)
VSGHRLLAQIPLFETLPRQELERLAKSLRVLELPPGTVLFREGDRGDRFYIVLDGQVDVFQTMEGRGEHLLARRGRGEFLGEMSLLNPDGRRTASIRSRGTVKLYEMTRVQFDALLEHRPALAYEMARELSARMTAAQTQTIRELQEKNRQLNRAYKELKSAQAQLVEKERMERELQLAHEIQMSILPATLARLPGFEIGARMEPARAVGGDFYDAISLSPDKVALIIGDVTDKGVPAAIYMAQIHALLRAGADAALSPGQILQNVNCQLWAMNGPDLYATVLFGVLDGSTDRFSYARAGHEPPMLVTADSQAQPLPWSQGQPLGLLEKPALDERVVTIPSGATLLLYTDGLIDGRNRYGAPFGQERLMDCLCGLTGKHAQDICDGLWQILSAYQGSALQDDDVTVVAVHSTAF